ncbi:MAG: alpha/beta fold hydrolase [Pseudomonadota bacterium]
MTKLPSITIGLAGLLLALLCLWRLEGAREGLVFEDRLFDATPATIIRPAAPAGPVPTVLIAHGFAGAKELMEPFAVSLARAGYITLSFDFEGHGRHPTALPARITGEGGAADRLIAQLGRMAAHARALEGADGRLVLLGHSMATDLIANAALQGIEGEVTVAVSLFSPDVTATSPRNMLIVTGSWEDGLTQEALRVTTLTAGEPAVENVTYGRFEDGTARRTVFSQGVEHIGVLYDPAGLEAARDWLDAAFGRTAAPDRLPVDARGPAIAGLFAGLMAFGWGLARLLPQLSNGQNTGAGAPRGLFFALAFGPAVLTPPLAVLIPTGAMPLVLGDYLAVHFALYGLLTAGALWFFARRQRVAAPALTELTGRLALAGVGAGGFVIAAFAITLDRYAFPFLPGADRLILVPVLAAALLPWFLADEWLTRGRPRAPESPEATETRRGSRLWAYALTKIAFVLSLGLAVALDPPRLFFLLIVAPVILVFFAVYGLISQRLLRVSGHPFVAAVALSLALAWSIATSFPLVAG